LPAKEAVMAKLAIIINGKPGAGKDALCDAVVRQGRARKISSIGPIAEIARQGGWDGVKTPQSRKLLSDLKRAFAEFNDLPNQYLLNEYRAFLCGEDDILFIHIREKDQVEAFRKAADGRCVTLLIRRPGAGGVRKYGNASDDDVERISYDVIFDNDQPLEESSGSFCNLMDYLLQTYA
jgi:hypothetical protein